MSDWVKMYDALLESVVGLAEATGFMHMALTLDAPKDEYREIYEKHYESLKARQTKVQELLHEWEVQRQELEGSKDDSRVGSGDSSGLCGGDSF